MADINKIFMRFKSNTIAVYVLFGQLTYCFGLISQKFTDYVLAR